MKVLAVIPARYGSERLRGKPLLKLCGKPMIQHVYERTIKAKNIDEVIVATDDKRILDTVLNFNGKAIMTSTEHKTGTDRIAEVALKSDADIIINVQGDEPLIDPKLLESVVKPLLENKNIIMSTCIRKIDDPLDIENPNIVKVIKDKLGFAIYFSRSPIPFNRSKDAEFFRHIGIYVFKKDFLIKFSKMEQTKAEKAEKLEQLRVIENGYKIKVIETKYKSLDINVAEDVAAVEQVLKNM